MAFIIQLVEDSMTSGFNSPPEQLRTGLNTSMAGVGNLELLLRLWCGWQSLSGYRVHCLKGRWRAVGKGKREGEGDDGCYSRRPRFYLGIFSSSLLLGHLLTSL